MGQQIFHAPCFPIQVKIALFVHK